MARKVKKAPEASPAPEVTVDEALRVLYADYFTEVRALAVEALKQPEGEARDQWLHETIDGHERVIYTYKAKLVGICTDNPDACEDETGEKPSSPEVAAYWSIRADVEALLGDSYFLADNAPKGEDPED